LHFGTDEYEECSDVMKQREPYPVKAEVGWVSDNIASYDEMGIGVGVGVGYLEDKY